MGKRKQRLRSLSEPRAPDEFEPIRRLRFVNNYIATGGNGAEAARLAGYSETRAKVTASELLNQPDVKLAIAERIQLELDAAKIDDEGKVLIREAAYLAHSDLADAFNEDNTLKPVRQMPVGIRRALAGCDVDPKSGIVKVRVADKRGALEFLAKMKKLLKDLTVEHDGTDKFLKALANLDA